MYKSESEDQQKCTEQAHAMVPWLSIKDSSNYYYIILKTNEISMWEASENYDDEGEIVNSNCFSGLHPSFCSAIAFS